MNDNDNPTLPPLSDAGIARIEHEVFAQVADEPREAPAPRTDMNRARRRRRRWVTGVSIAAAFVGGILIAPPLLTAVSPLAVNESMSDDAGWQEGPVAATDEMVASDAAMESMDSAAGSADMATDGREIISMADIGLQVTDVGASVESIGALAAEYGGYVEATDVGMSPDAALTEPGMPSFGGNGWISIRVPAEDLTAVMEALGDEGEVLRSSVSRQDVTSVVVDLQARADAARASVERLTELMAQSGSVGDLIAAESALSERQAQLESYEQQLKGLDEQVTMATVSISLTETPRTTADPAGFVDGLIAGWNGLIVSLNAIVVAFGFILPWLAIVGVAGLLIWWALRRRRTRAATGEKADSATESA
ncbi:DUF4349 domain-containing protein [Microbacterium esteraromaticum]|uniref:DUF4349 domain-containing protein n=1 Tax=Microbacterium esteraromaticum TaxID=57043 RepID=UPI001A9067F0|nr:DUF4349 domain-containing protein [Microbacterium esteraromaticum]MBN8423532.1 DUF4349 domain-containing protein [Microbacterium esteraromaticum]